MGNGYAHPGRTPERRAQPGFSSFVAARRAMTDFPDPGVRGGRPGTLAYGVWDPASALTSVRNCIAWYGQLVAVFHWLTIRLSSASVEPGTM